MIGIDISQYRAGAHPPGKDSTTRQNVGQIERIASAGAGLGLLLTGLKKGHVSGLLLAAGGASLIYRGVSGFCQLYRVLGINTAGTHGATAIPAGQGRKVEQSIVIHRTPEELYAYWADVQNLPQVFEHLVSVESTGGDHSHWRAKGPLNSVLEWDAEVIRERPNEMISWRSLEGSEVDTAGSVHFRRLPGELATELRVSLKYNPPGGSVSAGVADFLGQGLETRLQVDLHRFKQRMEAGEAAPLHSQSSPTLG